MLEWIIGLLKALVKGRYTGGVNIRFKDGGISSVTKPKEKKDGLNSNLTITCGSCGKSHHPNDPCRI